MIVLEVALLTRLSTMSLRLAKTKLAVSPLFMSNRLQSITVREPFSVTVVVLGTDWSTTGAPPLPVAPVWTSCACAGAAQSAASASAPKAEVVKRRLRRRGADMSISLRRSRRRG